jgi:hypothetical protein
MGKDRWFQFDHRQQLCSVRKSPTAKHILLNGVEFTGVAENNMQPGGSSQQLMLSGNSMCCAIRTAPNMASDPAAK